MLAWVWLLWHIVAALGPHQTNFPRRLLLGWVVIVGSTTAALGLLAAPSMIGIGSPRLSAALGLVLELLGLPLTAPLYRTYQAIVPRGAQIPFLATAWTFASDIFLYGHGPPFGAPDPVFPQVARPPHT